MKSKYVMIGQTAVCENFSNNESIENIRKEFILARAPEWMARIQKEPELWNVKNIMLEYGSSWDTNAKYGWQDKAKIGV